MKRKSCTVIPARQVAIVPTTRHLPLVDLLVDTRTELLELAVRSGLKLLEAMMEEDRVALCGVRDAYESQQPASRAGAVASAVRKVAVRRPRVRADGHEVALPTFQAMAHTDPLNRRVVEQMLVGVSTRQYARSLEPIGDALIVIEAGNLGARSKLRKAFEGSKTVAAAIPCYADDGRTLNEVISRTLAASGLRASRDAMAYLAANLGNDRMISRAELEKLALYMAGHEEVSLDDAMACVGDSASMTLDDLVDAAAGGNLKTLPKMQDRAVQEGIEPIAILRALGRHFQQLHACAGLMAEGMPLDGAVKALRPPVFFRRVDAFRAQLRLWGPGDVDRALDWLTGSEKECKTTGLPAETICHQTLLRLAASARALAGRRRN